MLIYLQQIDSPEDKLKFEQIYIQYRKLMFMIAKNILKNEQDAEDAVHQAFLSIAKNMGKITTLDSAKTKAYIVTIMERRAIDVYRERKRTSAEPLDEDFPGLEFEAPHTSPLADAIAKLPVHYRHVILLKYYCGYSNQEIAKILGLSYEGVHSAVQRAKKKLKELLEEEGAAI